MACKGNSTFASRSFFICVVSCVTNHRIKVLSTVNILVAKAIGDSEVMSQAFEQITGKKLEGTSHAKQVFIQQEARRFAAEQRASTSPALSVTQSVPAPPEGEPSPITEGQKENAPMEGAENRMLNENDLSDYMKTGAREHVRNAKADIASRGGSPILTTLKSIKEFIIIRVLYYGYSIIFMVPAHKAIQSFTYCS